MESSPGGARPRGCVITCEHATNRVPAAVRQLLDDPATTAALETHRGWDPGAAPLARVLAARLQAPLHLATVTRLLVDTNRTPGHPRLHGAWGRSATRARREAVIARWHRPHVDAVSASVAAALEEAPRVLHLAVHSFTPVLDGVVRTADIGLLYDPGHDDEAGLATRWAHALRAATGLRVRRNYPYRGRDDGLTRSLRRRFGASYAGIELELNQALLVGDRFPALLCRQIADTLSALLAAAPPPPTSP
ncbi:MAG: N-formylglutamate amidohydrolase [Pseudomonadales bacterium]|jgi:predicted N-formylglutamate amidohydrolase|nr:N-formylglutamate amidohydrolase [Pseudomonadales bacterium]